MTSHLIEQPILNTESHNSTLGDILNDLVEQRKSWLESFENSLTNIFPTYALYLRA